MTGQQASSTAGQGQPGSIGPIHLDGEVATARFARAVAGYTVGGDIILLQGPLGAGKTAFARAFIRACFPSVITVQSPTFTIVQRYEPSPGDGVKAPSAILHFDLYRLSDPAELAELDIDSMGAPDTVCLIEWPEMLGDSFAGDALSVVFLPGDPAENPDHRQVRLLAAGNWLARLPSDESLLAALR